MLIEFDKKNPLIVDIHGGPSSYKPQIPHLNLKYLLLSKYYNILLPNYIGSISYGQNSINMLKNQAGKIDVENCIKMIK